MNIEDFEALIDTGDLIFFRSNTVGGRVQRFVTNSEFDHVAMALKYRKPATNEMPSMVKFYVLEATGINGVDIYSWDQFV